METIGVIKRRDNDPVDARKLLWTSYRRSFFDVGKGWLNSVVIQYKTSVSIAAT
jgi:hypothetical protein